MKHKAVIIRALFMQDYLSIYIYIYISKEVSTLSICTSSSGIWSSVTV